MPDSKRQLLVEVKDKEEKEGYTHLDTGSKNSKER